MKKILYIFSMFAFLSCSPKLFIPYEKDGVTLEKIDLVKLNKYLYKKQIPNFEKSTPWSNADQSTGSYLFTSKNGKTKIAIAKKDGEFILLKKMVELENKVIINEYLSNGNLKKSDTVLKSSITKRPQIDITIKNPAPDFTYKNIEGVETSLSDFLGKYVYINIWATWSVPSQREILALNKIIGEFKNKNIVFINLAIEDSKADYRKWKETVDTKNLKDVQLFCGESWDCNVIKDYKIYHIPRAILINPEGKVIDAFAPRPSDATLEKTLTEILSF